MSEQRTIFFSIDERPVSCHFEGEVREATSQILIVNDDNLLINTPHDVNGYGVINLFTPAALADLKARLTVMVAGRLRQLGIGIDARFSLEKYHTYVTDQEHLSFVFSIKDCMDIALFPGDAESIARTVGRSLGEELTFNCPGLDDRAFFCLRIVRPHSITDANPPHRDAYLDRLRNAVNLYVPLAGSSAASSLSLLPSSHKWAENEITVSQNGSMLNGVVYSVPSVLTTQKPYILTRPNPKEGEVLLFSPYIIHGAGYNYSEDETRMSLEMRLWKKK